MRKKLLFGFMVMALALSALVSTPVFAETSYIGSVVKLADGDTLYYVAADGKRYVYPNVNIYNSWFTNFNDVVTISAEALAAIPLGGSIQYRPGIILIKVQTDPKVYAVSQNGTLRWVKTESLARQLYGDDWANLVDDLQASFFASYHIGDDIDKNSDYDADEEASDNDSFEHSHGLAIGHSIRHGNTVRCRVLNRVLDKLTDRGAGHSPEAIARVLDRKCDRDDDDDGDNSDKVAPTISGIAASAATSTATITWTTNEAATSKVKYADQSLATASSTDTVSSVTLVTSHSLQLSGLTASTTYYFMVESKDSNGNKATSTQQMFTSGN